MLAKRIEREAKGDARVERAFELVLNRRSTTEEMTAARKLVQEHGLTALSRALLNASEFLYVY